MAESEPTEQTPKAENSSSDTADQPETKRRRKRASGWDTPVVAPTTAVPGVDQD
jgi:hypothetical protein